MTPFPTSYVGRNFRLLGKLTCSFSVTALSLLAQSVIQTGQGAEPPRSVAAPSHANARDSERTYYTQADFRLPFRVRPGGRCPELLDLIVSKDAGLSWQTHQTVVPSEGEFQILCPAEGVYWLAVQARDGSRASTGQSAMRLIVDRTKPLLELSCDWQPDGTALIACRVSDPNVDLSSLQLQLRTNTHPQYHALNWQISPEANVASTETVPRFVAAAKVRIEGCDSFQVHVSVKDLAENQSTVTERYFHPESNPQSRVLLSDNTLPEAPSSPLQLSAPESIELLPPEVNNPALDHSPAPAVALNTSPALGRNALATDSVGHEASVQSSGQSIGRMHLASLARPAAVHEVVSPSRKLTLSYSLRNASVPVHSVELWATTDGGRSWEFWGHDNDSQSPCRIEVDRDGQFGFCVVTIQSQDDVALRPKAGDAPDLIVRVQSPGPTSAFRLVPVSAN